MTQKRFRLGTVCSTPGAAALLEEHQVSPLSLLQRHQSGDWGDLSSEDMHYNEEGLMHGMRLLSSYVVGDERVWIITEADRSVTTLLLPSEY